MSASITTVDFRTRKVVDRRPGEVPKNPGALVEIEALYQVMVALQYAGYDTHQAVMVIPSQRDEAPCVLSVQTTIQPGATAAMLNQGARLLQGMDD